MTSIDERHDSLKAFKPIFLFEYIHEDSGINYQLIFFPSMSLFKIISSESEGRLPPIVISYHDFVRGKTGHLNTENKVDSVILLMSKLWEKMDKSEKMKFCDNVPLNSLYLGCQYR